MEKKFRKQPPLTTRVYTLHEGIRRSGSYGAGER